MRAITITAYRRPQLFPDLLVSLRANDLNGRHVFVRVEPSPRRPSCCMTSITRSSSTESAWASGLIRSC